MTDKDILELAEQFAGRIDYDAEIGQTFTFDNAGIRELTAAIRELLEVQIALYQADAERIWSMMPELRNTDAHYEIHEALHEKLRQLEQRIAESQKQNVVARVIDGDTAEKE